MAGYLGTLFMANVGMRLLLPPKSEYNQAATNFGRMVSGIQQKQKSYFSSASKTNISSLQQTLQRSTALAKKYGKEQSSSTLNELKNNLNRIKSITKSSMSTVSSGMSQAGRSTRRIGNIISRMPTQAGRGMSGNTFAKKYEHGLRAIDVELKKISISQRVATKAMTETADAMSRGGTYMLNTYRSALQTSVTLLTTVGYAVSGLSQDFSTFERELINANSIWQETSKTLFEISDRVIRFGEEYGIAYDNASRVLYQFASAGLEAAEAQAVLNDVLLLSMAVQGDANTIGKLTVQTIKGFGMEMSDAGEVTDKFAHSINASLIEYQDLASAIKFALPFYSATNQNLDQLLGSIQVLTDRALEAGIAGRGLRQALAEFAEGAEDATRKFAKMGVEVVNQEGEFLKMTEIARNFANVIGGSVANDTELLTSLIEDLNIRGATAFIHLVQNVDEFEEAVAELSNSQGASAKMAEMQQGSLAMLTQKMRNAMKEVFFLSEAQFVANGHMNEFDMRLKGIVTSFTELFLQTMPDGSKQLTQFAYDIRTAVIESLEGFADLVKELVPQIIKLTQGGFSLGDMVKAMFIPLNILNRTLELTDIILGTVGGSGLIFKFGALSMMFGGTAAAAFMMADALGAAMDRLGDLGRVIGPVLTIMSLFYGLGGLNIAARGVAGKTVMGATGKSLLKKNSLTQSKYGYKPTYKQLHSKEFPTGKPPADMVYPEGYKSLNQMRMEAMGTGMNPAKPIRTPTLGSVFDHEDLLTAGKGAHTGGQTTLGMYGLHGAPTTTYIGQQRFGSGLGTGRYKKLFANQQQPFDASLEGGAGLQYRLANEIFEQEYLGKLGMSRAKWGAFGTYAGGRASLNSWGIGQNRASDPMMAQMATSSNMSSGQDLYIANANIGSTNLQDLFYNSDQLTG